MQSEAGLGRSVRLDTGLYVPMAFYEPRFVAVSAPLDVWIQCSRRLWLGPMGVRWSHQGPAERTDVSLGFGLGYSLSRALNPVPIECSKALADKCGSGKAGMIQSSPQSNQVTYTCVDLNLIGSARSR